MNSATPSDVARLSRKTRTKFRDCMLVADTAQEAIRERPAVSASEFTFALHAGHLALVCPACGRPVYPLRGLGQAYSRVRAHLAEAHDQPGRSGRRTSMTRSTGVDRPLGDAAPIDL